MVNTWSFKTRGLLTSGDEGELRLLGAVTAGEAADALAVGFALLVLQAVAVVAAVVVTTI